MINAANFKISISYGFKMRMWASVAVSLFSCAVWAQTYPVSGVWVARDDRFPGSTAGACLILKKFGLDGVLAQPFPNLMIFSKERRFEVRGNHLAERHIRSVKSTTDGGFQITESLGKRSLLFSKKQFFTLKVIDPTTIEITEAKISTQLFKCSSNSGSL
jgi:hypothetical protein